MGDKDSAFNPEIVTDGARIVALRLDDDLVVREVVGGWWPVPVGQDIRETVHALVGMEDVLAEDTPDLHLPFVTLGFDGEAPTAITAVRDDTCGTLWVLLRDVTEEANIQRRLVQQHNAIALAQRELAAARDAALAADRTKTVFLANVSHELRTPLNVVIGGASILLKPRSTPLPEEEVRGFARDIHDSGELLLQLVNDLIDLSRAESGNLKLYEEWCSINAIVGEILRLTRALPGAEGIAIEQVSCAHLPEFFADQTRIKQILLNLLSNAVKACSPENRISVEAKRGTAGELLLAVRDDGPGMSRRELVTALEPFGQLQSSKRAQGAGLGLSIVSRLAQLHGGKLDIETAPDKGLSATVTLPADRFADRKTV